MNNLDYKQTNILLQLNEETLCSSDHHFGHKKVYEEFEPIRTLYANSFEEFETKTINNWNEKVKNNIIIYNGDFAINKRNKDSIQKRINKYNEVIKSDLKKEYLINFLENNKRKQNPDLLDLYHSIKDLEDTEIENLLRIEINKLDNLVNKETIKNTISKLSGQKILICGNHDTLQKIFYLEAGWDIVVQNEILFIDNNEIKRIKSPSNLQSANGIICTINNKRIFFSHFNLFNIEEPFEKAPYRYSEEIKYLLSVFKEYKCDINIHGHIHSLETRHPFSYNVSIERNEFTPKSIKDIIK